MSTDQIVGTAIAVPVLIFCLWFMVAWVISLFDIFWSFAKVRAEGRRWTDEDQRRLDKRIV